MTDIFLESGRIRQNSLSINDQYNCKGIKIADLITGISKKTSSIIGSLSICDQVGPREFDTQNAEVFAMLSPAPDPSMRKRKQRDVIFIVAPSGSGKSTWSARYAVAYQKTKSLSANSKMPRVIMFSAVPEDDEFDDRIHMKRIAFDDLIDSDGIPTDVIQIEDLKDSLVIFDDIDVIPNKRLQKWMTDLRDRCLQIGRHHNISMLCTAHEILNYGATKILHTEANKIVVFPRSGAAEQLKRYFRSKGGLDKEQTDRVMKLQTQWVMLSKSYPRYIMHANGAYFLDSVD